MVEGASVQSGDVVLEIGPGLGTLTDQLLSTDANVIALEYDAELFRVLQKKYATVENIRVQEGDIRTYDFSVLPAGYKIVANIPYYLTANLFRKLVDDDHKPEVAALLVQKEVAERASARPGQMSFVSVALQLFYYVSLGEIVPAYLFEPAPKVDSQILILSRRKAPLFADVELAQLFNILKAGFAQRRKKLRSSLSAGLGIGKSDIELWLKRADVSPAARPQELSLEQWYNLYKTKPSL